MRVQHSAHAAFDRLDRLGQQDIELLDSSRLRSPQVAAGGGLGDAGVVEGRREGNVEVFVAGFGAEAVWVDEEEGAFGGVPACEKKEGARQSNQIKANQIKSNQIKSSKAMPHRLYVCSFLVRAASGKEKVQQRQGLG